MEKQTRTYSLFAIVGVAGIFAIGAIAHEAQKPNIPASFAQCITDSGAKMFGAFWCPHCQAQKDLFGDSFEEIEYIECSLPDRSGQTQECIDEGIESYPTWEFGDGTRQTGEVPLEILAEKTGCELPPTE